MACKFSLKMPDFHVAFRDILQARKAAIWYPPFSFLAAVTRFVYFFFRPEKSDGFGRV
jgi:hypothetical protein